MKNETYKIVYSPYHGGPLVSDKPATIATIVSRDENLINFVEKGQENQGFPRRKSLLETKEDERLLVKAIDSITSKLLKYTDISDDDLAWLLERIKSHAKWGTLEVETINMEYVVSVEERHDGLEKLVPHYNDGFIIPPIPCQSREEEN